MNCIAILLFRLLLISSFFQFLSSSTSPRSPRVKIFIWFFISLLFFTWCFHCWMVSSLLLLLLVISVIGQCHKKTAFDFFFERVRMENAVVIIIWECQASRINSKSQNKRERNKIRDKKHAAKLDREQSNHKCRQKLILFIYIRIKQHERDANGRVREGG